MKGRLPLAVTVFVLVFSPLPSPSRGRAVAGIRLGKIQEFVSSSLDGASVGATSSDGAQIYVGNLDHITVLARDPGTGLVSFVQDVPAGNVTSVALSPDGIHVYASSNGAFAGPSVTIFARNPVTGELTFIDQGGTGAATYTTVSPDGDHVYTAHYDYLHAFVRNPVTGEITFVESETGGIGVLDGLYDLRRMLVSPDGAHLYVTAGGFRQGGGGSGIGVYARNTSTGELTFVQAVTDGPPSKIAELYRATGIGVSLDGTRIYVGSDLGDGLLVFDRTPATGMLSLVELLRDGVGGAYGFAAMQSLRVSSDGERVYTAGGTGSDRIGIFTPFPDTALLAFRHAEDFEGISFLKDIVPSPDGRNVYALVDGALTAYTTGPLCPDMPLAGCRTAGKSIFALKDGEEGKSDKIAYKWLKGEETHFVDFGDPFSNGATSYALCLYDEGGSGQELRFDANAPARGLCGTPSCWSAPGSPPDFNALYRDPYRTPDGLSKILLKPGDAGKAKVLVSGKGEFLPPLPTIPVSLPLTVQVMNSDGECWSSTFDVGDVTQTPASSGTPASLKAITTP